MNIPTYFVQRQSEVEDFPHVPRICITHCNPDRWI